MVDFDICYWMKSNVNYQMSKANCMEINFKINLVIIYTLSILF